jgi:beta-glucosidase
MKKALKKTYKILVACFGTLFGITYTVGTIAFENKPVINGVLNQPDYKYEAGTSTGADTDYFKSAYTSLTDVMNHGRDVCEAAEEEGAVLLKNANKALPLKSDSRKVSLVGITSVDPVYGGTGSGAVKSTDAETMKDAMTNAGFSINTNLWDWYTANKDAYKRGTANIGTGFFTEKIMKPNDAPWDVVNTNVGSSFATFGDAAIVVLGRVGGEGNDMPAGTTATPSKTEANAEGDYLNLTDVEKGLFVGLKGLKDAGTIKKIVVLLNSANAMETAFIDNAAYGIDAAMWIGTTGHTGLSGIAKLLAGDNNANPSGGLSDTYYADNKYNPVLANFGDYTYADSASYADTNNSSYDKYVVYQEGIYLGYKYTETRYEDAVTKRAKTGTFNYKDAVSYPFGYGLSYTDFSFSDFKVTKTGDDYKVSVKVTNTGSDYSGKKPVQIYIQKPYTSYDEANGIEKAAVELLGYAKTGVLAPNASETVDVTVTGRDFASYDANKAKTYIVDAGDYYLTAASDSHEAINNILAAKGFSKADGMTADGQAALTYKTTLAFSDTKYSYSAETNAKIKNLFDEADLNKNTLVGDDNKVTYLSRSNWEGTFPTAAPALKMTKEMSDEMLNMKNITGDETAYPTYGASNGLQLIDLMKDAEGKDIPYDSPIWETLLDELTWDDTLKVITNGLRQTAAIDTIGKIGTRDHNGPTGCTQPYGEGVNGLAYKTGADPSKTKYPTCYPCNGIIASTFSGEVSAKVGDAIGEDALWAGYSGLYGPCSNIHRSPYEGRCFEYYSEDAVLSGSILAVETKGIQSHGCYVYNKHFALNDQETNRSFLFFEAGFFHLVFEILIADRIESHQFPRGRMLQNQLKSVQDLALVGARGLQRGVELISDDRMVKISEVDADLMGPPGLQAAFKQSGAFILPEDFEMGHRGLAVADIDGHALAVEGIPADRRFDLEELIFKITGSQSQVFPLDGMDG